MLLIAGILQMWTALAQPVQVVNPDKTVDTWASGKAPDGHVPYHPQVTAFFCGASAMEMEADCNAVRNANPILDVMLGGGVAGANPGAAAVDGVPQPCFPGGRCNAQACFAGGVCWQPAVFNGNQVVFGVQTFMYGLVHGFYTYNGFTYLNPFYPAGQGTTLDELAAGLNLMDSPANNAGQHNYIAYNVLNPDWANRTMADGLAQLGIPSAAIIKHGAHWICVVGVKTDVPPVANGRYKIYGFYIHDPWFGYWNANPKDLRGNKLPPGMAENTFCGTKINPNRVAANDAAWASLFNYSPGPPLPYYGSGLGYKFEVEPIGPIALDTGNNGEYTSIPDPSPILTNSPLSAPQALVYATNALAGDTYLSSQAGFTNGNWDVANAMLIQYPTDGPGEGDWLVPYEGSGGTNDVTGYVMIDIETGDLDEAVWMNPGDMVTSITLDDAETVEMDEYAGIFPDDNAGEPQLAIQSTGSNTILLSWPTSVLANYALQFNTSLTSTNWITLTNAPNVVNNVNQMTFAIAGPQQMYFRLISQ